MQQAELFRPHNSHVFPHPHYSHTNTRFKGALNPTDHLRRDDTLVIITDLASTEGLYFHGMLR